MCTPNKQAKTSQHLTPCRRLGLRRTVHNFTPPFKGNREDSSSPNVVSSTPDEETPTQSAVVNNRSLECETPVKTFVKPSNKRLFEDEAVNPAPSVSGQTDFVQDEEISENSILRKKKDIAMKKMKLHKLQLQDINADELKVQISVWKTACRDILEELLSATQSENIENRNEHVLKLLNGFNIPCELIGYDPVSEEFVD